MKCSIGRCSLLALIVPSVLIAIPYTADADGDASNIVFVVRDYMNSGGVVSGTGREMKIRTLMEPFAYIDHGTLVALPDDEKIDFKEFEKTYYSNSHQYKLISAGKVTGTTKVTATAFDIQCESLAATATVNPSAAVSGMHMALATNAPIRDMGYVRRAATPSERDAFIKLAHDLYSGNSVKDSVTAKAEIQNLTVIEGSMGTILVGSSMATENVMEDTYDSRGQIAGSAPAMIANSIFIIAEKSDDGGYRSTFSWFNSGSDNTFQSQDFVDILTLPNEAEPELVTQFNYYESTEYHVYKKANGKWADYFKNSGSGC